MKFFVDSMPDRLAIWMRVLGYDVEYERSIEDAQLVDRATEEGRIIVTRDTRLLKWCCVRDRSSSALV